MPIEATIVGHDHKNGLEGQATLNNPKGRPIGLMVYTESFTLLNPEVHPFLNDDFGIAMNQNVSFSGSPELVHDGTDNAGWTGSAVSGTWDFSDTTNPQAGANCVSLTSGVNNDEALFSDGTTTDMSGFTALTGQFRLDTYNSANNSVLISFSLAGAPVGNSININDFINAGILDVYQGFAIPKSEFGLTTQTVDEMNMVLVRSGGPQPTFRFDVLQWEQTGNPVIFTSSTPKRTRFHVTEIRLGLADNITGIVTGSTTTYPTMLGLAYDALLGVSTLSNGITFSRVQSGKTVFAITLKQLGDFLSSGSNIVNAISDGTNTFITLQVTFPEAVILDGNAGDFLSFTINDNLSGLLQFTAVARGSIEQI